MAQPCLQDGLVQNHNKTVFLGVGGSNWQKKQERLICCFGEGLCLLLNPEVSLQDHKDCQQEHFVPGIWRSLLTQNHGLVKAVIQCWPNPPKPVLSFLSIIIDLWNHSCACLCACACVHGLMGFYTHCLLCGPKGVGRLLWKVGREREKSRENLERQKWCTQVSGCVGAVPQRAAPDTRGRGCLGDPQHKGSNQGFVSPLTGVWLHIYLPGTSPLLYLELCSSVSLRKDSISIFIFF